MLIPMSKPVILSETATLRRNGAVWEAVLITVGQGSSGLYTEEMLQAAAETKVFPAGTKNWFKHKEWRGEQRDPRDQWGFHQEDAQYRPGELYAPIKILGHWQDVVESLAEDGQAELSIFAAGIVNEETGELVGLAPFVTNSVDMVDYPGRPGSKLRSKVERVLESYKPAAESSAEEKEERMDPKDLAAIIDGVAAKMTESLAPVLTFVTDKKTAEEKAAQTQVEASVIESAVESAVTSYAEKAKAIEDAEILPSQKEALLAEARKGVDTTAALASAVKLAEEAKATFGKVSDEDEGAPEGRVNESGASKSAVQVAESIPGW